ncbi:MAG: hypothetical protein ACI9GC_000503 [Phycisphaerales bacterium]|jgi:hypothetical protein
MRLFLALYKEVFKWNESYTDCRIEHALLHAIEAHPAYHVWRRQELCLNV